MDHIGVLESLRLAAAHRPRPLADPGSRLHVGRLTSCLKVVLIVLALWVAYVCLRRPKRLTVQRYKEHQRRQWDHKWKPEIERLMGQRTAEEAVDQQRLPERKGFRRRPEADARETLRREQERQRKAELDSAKTEREINCQYYLFFLAFQKWSIEWETKWPDHRTWTSFLAPPASPKPETCKTCLLKGFDKTDSACPHKVLQALCYGSEITEKAGVRRLKKLGNQAHPDCFAGCAEMVREANIKDATDFTQALNGVLERLQG